jgi:hypothetical protein
MRVAELLSMDDDLEGALLLLLRMHGQVRVAVHFVSHLSYSAKYQCVQQQGAASVDSITAALAAGCICSKIGNVRQAEALLRQAYVAAKARAEKVGQKGARLMLGADVVSRG